MIQGHLSVIVWKMEVEDVQDILVESLSRNTLLNLKYRDLVVEFKKQGVRYTIYCSSEGEVFVHIFKAGFMCLRASISETHRFEVDFLLGKASNEIQDKNLFVYRGPPALRDFTHL